ncbi:MAG: hypothetical protein GXO43_09940 [Crenarchaeota archaeon]|nr:hypothetical protein [Thermoproteota archaeon]
MGYRLTVYISVPESELKDFAKNLNNALQEMGYRSISSFISDILVAVANAYKNGGDPDKEIQRVMGQRKAQFMKRTRILNLIRGVIR